MADTPTTSDVLMRAAQRLMEHGWTQGQLHQGDAACAYGAISDACRDLKTTCWSEADSALSDHIETEYGTLLVGQWNDAPERTVEDVVLALKRAATETAGG